MPPRRTQPNAQALTAAAQRLDPTDRGEREQQRKSHARSNTWQQRAWYFYDEVPEVWFAHRFYGNALSRVRIYAAYRPDPEQPPVPLDPEQLAEDEATSDDLDLINLATAARVEMQRLEQGMGSMSGMLRDIGTNLALVGECNVVGYDDTEAESGETWNVLSTDELEAKDDAYYERRSEADNEGKRLPDDALIMRIWRRHPRFRELPDAPMRALLGICDELLLLTRAIRGAALARLHAGILKVPTELTFPTAPADATKQASDDPFLAKMIEALTTPISDPDSASGVVPFLVKGPAEALKEFQHVDISRPIEDTFAKQRQELIVRFAHGVDLPVEIVTGMTDANHWTAWQIDEQTFKAHIEPMLLVIVEAFTQYFLQPALRDAGLDAQRVIVWYDESDLIGHPNEFENAKEMHQRFAVSDAYLRRKGGASEDDAPDDEELARRIGITKGILTGDLFLALMKLAGVIPTNLEPEPSEVEAAPIDVTSTETTTTDDDDNADDTTPPGDAASVSPGPPEQAALLAAGERHARLGQRLMAIDRTLRLRVQQWADAAVQRALERAGASLRRRVQGSALKQQTSGVPNELLAAALGRTVVRSWNLDEADLIEAELERLEQQYRQATRKAYRDAIAAAIEELEAELDDALLAELDESEDENISAGWAMLAGAVTAIAREQLFAPTPDAPPQGEFDASVRVPAGTVRESLSIAGGATSVAPTGIESQAGAAGRPSGGIATGDLVLSTFERALDAVPSGWVWVYGDPGTRTQPFEPHNVLDGVEFAQWDDDVLANSEGWPAVTHYRPGDHAGCQCDFAPVFTTRGD